MWDWLLPMPTRVRTLQRAVCYEGCGHRVIKDDLLRLRRRTEEEGVRERGCGRRGEVDGKRGSDHRIFVIVC